ncbi:MAG TPA: hypothetical protein ENI97_15600 [Gammaproteobacteria bacterium]|nr:hypothetical protein [Gammaproteobacteria bacterium]
MRELTLSICSSLAPAEPLWQRAPTVDETGQRLSDFMMLIPKLGKRPQQQIKQILEQLQRVIDDYHKAVVFVDLNLKLNVLWVSVKPVPGICLELPAAIKARIPEALLIGQPPRPTQ